MAEARAGLEQLGGDQWRQLFDAIADGVAVVTRDGVTVAVNDAFCRLTGFTRDELVGASAPFPYWPEEERPNIQAAFARGIGGESEDFNLVFCRKDGVRFPVLVHPAAVTGADGRPELIVATIKDVTLQQRNAAELVASRERWRSIAENPFDFVTVIDRNFLFTYVNHSIPGFPIEELLGKKGPFDFAPPDQHGVARL